MYISPSTAHFRHQTSTMNSPQEEDRPLDFGMTHELLNAVIADLAGSLEVDSEGLASLCMDDDDSLNTPSPPAALSPEPPTTPPAGSGPTSPAVESASANLTTCRVLERAAAQAAAEASVEAAAMQAAGNGPVQGQTEIIRDPNTDKTYAVLQTAPPPLPPTPPPPPPPPPPPVSTPPPPPSSPRWGEDLVTQDVFLSVEEREIAQSCVVQYVGEGKVNLMLATTGFEGEIVVNREEHVVRNPGAMFIRTLDRKKMENIPVVNVTYNCQIPRALMVSGYMANETNPGERFLRSSIHPPEDSQRTAGMFVHATLAERVDGLDIRHIGKFSPRCEMWEALTDQQILDLMAGGLGAIFAESSWDQLSFLRGWLFCSLTQAMFYGRSPMSKVMQETALHRLVSLRARNPECFALPLGKPFRFTKMNE